MSEIVERLKARAAWWNKVDDYIIEKRHEARGTEWFGRFNAIAHSVRGRVPVEEEAADHIEAQDARIERLENALKRMLIEFDFMIECNIISDVRNDVIFVEARAALEPKP